MANLEDRIASIVESHGASFYDMEKVSENGNTIVRVYITKDGGVDLDLCADISVDLSPMLDVHPPVDGHYYLEVSSPGIERILKKPSHFKSAIGERVKLRISGEGKKRGILTGADESEIVLKEKDGEFTYRYDSILKAKTYYDWSGTASD